MIDNDLHSRLVSSLTARLDRARAATPGPWVVGRTTELDWGMHPPGQIGDSIIDSDGYWPRSVVVEGTHVVAKGELKRSIADMARGYRDSRFVADASYIAANAPDVEIRRVEAALRVVQRHANPHGCVGPDGADWVFRREAWCPTLVDLAAGEGIEP